MATVTPPSWLLLLPPEILQYGIIDILDIDDQASLTQTCKVFDRNVQAHFMHKLKAMHPMCKTSLMILARVFQHQDNGLRLENGQDPEDESVKAFLAQIEQHTLQLPSSDTLSRSTLLILARFQASIEFFAKAPEPSLIPEVDDRRTRRMMNSMYDLCKKHGMLLLQAHGMSGPPIIEWIIYNSLVYRYCDGTWYRWWRRNGKTTAMFYIYPFQWFELQGRSLEGFPLAHHLTLLHSLYICSPEERAYIVTKLKQAEQPSELTFHFRIRPRIEDHKPLFTHNVDVLMAPGSEPSATTPKNLHRVHSFFRRMLLDQQSRMNDALMQEEKYNTWISNTSISSGWTDLV